MLNKWVKYDKIEESRNGYFVIYSPVFTGDEYATIQISIYNDSLINDVSKIAESELRFWIERFPTPVQVLITNYSDSDWVPQNVCKGRYLLGYPTGDDVVMCWDEFPEGKQPEMDLCEARLAQIYKDLKFTTSYQVIEEQKKTGKSHRNFLIILTIWFCLIPGLIAFLGWANPLVSIIALIYSLYIVLTKALKLWGLKHKSENDLANEKEELLKNHHHHHCKLNPDGFNRLKLENFQKEKQQKRKKKIEEMKIF